MGVSLISVYKGDTFYEKTVHEFKASWDHSKGPVPHIVQIFKVEHKNDAAARHQAAHRAYVKRVGNVQYLFHGTVRSCRTGDHHTWTKPCDHTDCSLCGILKISFDFKRAGSANGKMFGSGVYTTSVTSKATQYCKSTDPRTHTNVVLLSHIAVGKTCLMQQAAPTLTAPPPGYDSVTGATQAQGGSLIYPETIVYRPEAICVGGIIVFSQ